MLVTLGEGTDENNVAVHWDGAKRTITVKDGENTVWMQIDNKIAYRNALQRVASEKLVLGISLPSENSASILTKVGIAKRYKLQGIALWRLGLVQEEVWQALRTISSKPKAHTQKIGGG